MARYIDVIDLPLPIEEAFDYLADFSRTAEWDPGVSAARRITPGKPRVGSRFEVQVSLLGHQIPLEYSITELERPSRLVLSGGSDAVQSIDEITFVPRPNGTRVTYDARLELVGYRQLADPLLDLLFQQIGRVAMRGLRERMAEGAPGTQAKGTRKRSASTGPRKRGNKTNRPHNEVTQ